MVAVDFDDGVVNIDEDIPAGGSRGGYQGWSLHCQVDQEPGGHGIQLTDMSEGEGPEEGSQGRGCVDPVKQSAHPAVAQQVHVVDRVGPCDHAGDQGGDLRPGVGTLVTCHSQLVLCQGRQASVVGQAHGRGQAGGRHEGGIIKGNRECRGSVRYLHLRDALS